MTEIEARAAVLARYPTAKAVYEHEEQEWVVRVASIVLAGSHTPSGAWLEAALDLAAEQHEGGAT